MPHFILAIDQGTTGTRAIVFDLSLRPRGSAYLEHRQHYPKPGWVEHDPDEIWRNALLVVTQALRTSKVKAAQISAVGITNQRETLVAWDASSGEALHPAIVWQCRRSEEICKNLKQKGLENTIKEKTGLLLDPYFSGSKVRWLMENAPQVSQAARRGKLRLGTIDSFLIWKMTGGRAHLSDYTNASRTLLFDIRKKQWDSHLAKLFKTEAKFLPKVQKSAGVFASCQPESFAGISAPIAGVAGDQQAALFGQACWENGEAKNTYGTGCFFLMNLGSRFHNSRKGLLTTLACREDGTPCFALEGAVFIGGAVVQWLRDELKLFQKTADVEKMARKVPNSGGVVFVPAFVGLGAPDWEPRARGAILGLTRGSGREHIARAALEAIALQSAELIGLAEQESGIKLKSLKVDGGATANALLMQIQADLMGRPVERAGVLESTALGAAALAALGAGLVSAKKLKASLNSGTSLFRPKASASWRANLRKHYRQAVEASKQFLPVN